jgi:chromatin segregation and condensation protein Rec8/ScpA/Scc1 (kleisin family)
MPSDRLAKSQREDISPLGLLDPPDIRIECPAFTGSLSMLFVCVRERKIDLRDVPLAPVCEAYLRYVVDRENPDLESAAVALSALSYLLERKAWVLIPVPEVPEPEAEDLWDVIEPSAHEFLPAIEDLLQRRAERESLFFRTPDATPYELPFDTKAVTPLDLARAFERLLAKAKPDTVTPPSRPRRSLSDMMVLVMKHLPLDWKPLDEIVPGEFTRSEAVWWFLALLELIRLAQARVALVEGEAQFCREVAS